MRHFLIIGICLFGLLSCEKRISKIREKQIIENLINEYINNPNWEVRREKRRQLINQGNAIIPYLWGACATDYFEHLHHLIKLLKDMQGFDNQEWTSRREKIRAQTLSTLKSKNLDLEKSRKAMNQLSLFGKPQDAGQLTPYLESHSKKTRELALATIFRLGYPYTGRSDPQSAIAPVNKWANSQSNLTNREELLWEALEIADNPVYRQTIVQGLIHYVVAHPETKRSQAGRVWELTQRETDINIRIDFVLLLGVLGDERFSKPLLETGWLQSPNDGLKIATSWSLNELGLRNPQPK